MRFVAAAQRVYGLIFLPLVIVVQNVCRKTIDHPSIHFGARPNKSINIHASIIITGPFSPLKARREDGISS